MEAAILRLDRAKSGAYAILQPKAPNTLLIFVHGFGGNATETWCDFHNLLPEHDSSDMVFYSYGSFKFSTITSAMDFLRFLQDLGRETSQLTRGYSRLILVGHSEGSLLIRHALLLAYSRPIEEELKQILKKCQVALFAPAMFGFSPTGLVAILTNFGFLGSTINAVLRFSPAYVEMTQPNLLSNLKDQTERLAERDPEATCFRARVVFGSNENLVGRGYFAFDTLWDDQHGKNHITVCKPKEDFLFPIRFALNGEV